MPTTQHLSLTFLSLSLHKLCNRLSENVVILRAEPWEWLLLWNLFWYLLPGLHLYSAYPALLLILYNHCYSPLISSSTFLTSAACRWTASLGFCVWLVSLNTVPCSVIHFPAIPNFLYIGEYFTVGVCKFVNFYFFLFFFIFHLKLFYFFYYSFAMKSHSVAQAGIELSM